uniref:Uncharacterized protein n=1 Tax=Bacteroides fragilis TaxID=817 RepID=Q8RM76_BACFG|nr:unknown [Bacteroides fragilis]
MSLQRTDKLNLSFAKFHRNPAVRLKIDSISNVPCMTGVCTFPINSKDKFLFTLNVLSSVPLNTHFLRLKGMSKKSSQRWCICIPTKVNRESSQFPTLKGNMIFAPHTCI